MAAPLSCSAGHPSWCAWRMDVSAVEKGEEGSLLFILYRSHFQLNEHESLNTWGTVSPCLFCWQALVLLIIGQQVNFSTQSEAFPHLQEVPYLSSSSQYCILCASVSPTSNFLGVRISKDLFWTINTATLVKKAHHRLCFLRTLKKVHLSTEI